MTDLLFLLLFAACIENGHVPVTRADVFDVPDRPALDVLVVVDNSSSMVPHQVKLGDNFEGFVGPMVDAHLDYHIAVTTTDDGNDPAIADPARGAFVGPIVTDDMGFEEAEAQFVANVHVGSAGSGFESGLSAATLALTDHARLGDQIAEFLREDAGLSVIFVSDEEDQSPLTVSQYLDIFWGVKGFRDRGAFSASALTVTDPGACPTGTADYSSPGTRYLDLVERTGGTSANLCSDDFAPILEALSLANATTALGTFVLAGEPEPATLAVDVADDGHVETIPCEAGAWSFRRVMGGARPAVVFDPGHLPPPGSTVTVRYRPGNGQVADFCGGAS